MKKLKTKLITTVFLIFYVLFGLLIPTSFAVVYPGTFSFEGEVGKQGTEISFIDGDKSGSDCLAKVVAIVGEHDDVLEVSDNSGTYIVDIWDQFDSSQNNAEIEFYMRTSDVSKATWVIIAGDLENWDDGIDFTIQGSNMLIYRDGDSPISISVSSEKWYKIKISWECSSKKWSLYLDDALKADDIQFSHSEKADSFKGLQISTVGGHTGYSSYFDGIKYSWDILGGLPDWIIPTIIGSVAFIAVIVVVIKLKGRKSEKKMKVPKERKPKTPKAFRSQERIVDGKVVTAGARIVDGKVIDESTPTVKASFCPSCGASIREGAEFCESCGKELK